MRGGFGLCWEDWTVWRYMQGTLDFACGIYAVINGLALTHNLRLGAARGLLSMALWEFSRHDRAWKAFLQNETDHYWVVRYMLSAHCRAWPFKYDTYQPFSSSLAPGQEALDLENVPMYSGECRLPPAAEHAAISRDIWGIFRDCLSENTEASYRHICLFRFHRYLPDVESPVISHWTCGCRFSNNALYLHDASSEKKALFEINLETLHAADNDRPLFYIPPESIIILSKAR